MKDALSVSIGHHIRPIIELRQFLHQIPEPGMAEHKTSAVLLSALAEIGLPVQEQLAGTGLLAVLDTGRPGPYVMLRADMDGLPVAEHSGVAHHSRHEGYCHCCGHDGHCAALVGVARVLNDLRDHLCGTVAFLFQPGEEVSQGARDLLAGGLFSHRVPDAIFALHAWPHLPVGTVACKPGTMMATSDSFTLTVLGKGGHGARPGMARNPLLGIARVAEAFMEMTTESRVVSPCIARVGHKDNVIDESGTLTGTTRNLTPEARLQTLAEMREVATSICREVDMTAELSFDFGCPAVVTDDDLYARFIAVGSELLGCDRVVELAAPSMGSEDFGYYLEHVPGLLFRLGVGESSAELHNPQFDFADDALTTGITMLAGLAIDFCHERA